MSDFVMDLKALFCHNDYRRFWKVAQGLIGKGCAPCTGTEEKVLKLGKHVFEEDLEKSSLTVSVGDRENGSEWKIDCAFLKSAYDGEMVSPQIIINNIHTKKYDIRKFAGEKFSTRNVAESDQREDSFYLFEHEPFIKMKVKILAVEGERAHVTCKGTVVEDGYASPVKAVKFTWDCWLPLVVYDFYRIRIWSV